MRQALRFILAILGIYVLAVLFHVATFLPLSDMKKEPQTMIVDLPFDIEPVCVFPSYMFQPLDGADRRLNEP